MLKTEQLSFQHKNEPAIHFPDLELEQGGHYLILGASGCGKTTLLHMMGGLRRPTNGRIWVADTEITALRDSKLDQFRGNNIGIIFQRPHAMRALTVQENLQTAQHFAGQRSDKGRIREVLEHLKMENKMHKKMNALSEGEKQRVSVALALINKPRVILADEPTSSLDDRNAMEVTTLLESQATAENATLVIVTHDYRLKEAFPKHVIELKRSY